MANQYIHHHKKNRIIIKRLLITIIILFISFFLIKTISYLSQIQYIKLGNVSWDIIKYHNINIKKELQKSINKELQKSYFSIDIHYLNKKIQQHNWVDSVIVKRILFNNLYIKVQTHQIAFRLNSDKFLSKENKIFNAKNKKFIDAPLMITKEKNVNFVAKKYSKYQKMLDKINLKIKVIKVDKLTTLILNKNIVLKLGYQQQLKRLMSFIKFYQTSDKNLDSKTIDLRYHKGLAIGKNHQI
ncbi:Cell division protein FtsQ [hydrothermal vent metagenome]|uniref:Cell division protein FtsQ n=1 Tax=hydrothermal vent metagenome TaxID=652676 RepID=A0A1W1BQA5_9ZZZZ